MQSFTQFIILNKNTTYTLKSNYEGTINAEMKKTTYILTCILILMYAASLIIFSENVIKGVIDAVESCVYIIIPSLYAFMVISGFIVSSDIYRLLSRPFAFVAKYLFRIPADLFSVFIISSFAGYPVGAKMLTELYAEGKTDKSTAEKMMGYCYMGGPAFFCGAVGCTIYGNAYMGLVIFICILLSNITAAVISGLKNDIPSDRQTSPVKLKLTASDFISCINAGGISILKMCGIIIFFSTIISILDSSGILLNIASVISAITGLSLADVIGLIKATIEISNIKSVSSDISLLPLVTALLSSGGLCVLFQIEGIIQGKLSTHNFYLHRFVSIILSYLYCKILICIFDVNYYIQTSTNINISYRQNSPIPSVFLLFMTILLLSNNFIAKSKKM